MLSASWLGVSWLQAPPWALISPVSLTHVGADHPITCRPRPPSEPGERLTLCTCLTQTSLLLLGCLAARHPVLRCSRLGFACLYSLPWPPVCLEGHAGCLLLDLVAASFCLNDQGNPLGSAAAAQGEHLGHCFCVRSSAGALLGVSAELAMKDLPVCAHFCVLSQCDLTSLGPCA